MSRANDFQATSTQLSHEKRWRKTLLVFGFKNSFWVVGAFVSLLHVALSPGFSKADYDSVLIHKHKKKSLQFLTNGLAVALRPMSY
jgi:demethoxyubiquinone hydroxylase (CLK1/Coq7/Cat5 family)